MKELVADGGSTLGASSRCSSPRPSARAQLSSVSQTPSPLANDHDHGSAVASNRQRRRRVLMGRDTEFSSSFPPPKALPHHGSVCRRKTNRACIFLAKASPFQEFPNFYGPSIAECSPLLSLSFCKFCAVGKSRSWRMQINVVRAEGCGVAAMRP